MTHAHRLAGLAMIALTLSTASLAQQPTPEPPAPRQNVRYVQMEYIRVATGGYERMNELLYSNYFPALREAGLPLPTVIHPDSGRWTFIIVWTMPGGMRDLEFHTLPLHVRAGEIVLRNLGEARANALGEEWNRLIVEREIVVGHEHLRPLQPVAAPERR